MKKIALAALVLTTTSGCFNGCNKKKEQEAIEPPPPVAALPAPPAAAKPFTPDQIVERFAACWKAWNDEAIDVLKDCYTPDATFEAPGSGEPATKNAQALAGDTKQLKIGFPDRAAEPELVLLHGHDLVAITRIRGTHTGPFGDVKGMNQKLDFLTGQVLAVDDQGRIVHDLAYYDVGTMMGQLTPAKDHPVRAASPAVPKETVIAKDDAAEQANVALGKQVVDAFNKHDAKALGAALANDVVWSEQQNPKDWTKAEAVADAQRGWKAFSDMKMVPTSTWGAGAYVVVVGTIEGTNDGPMPDAGLAKATKKHVSLPYLMIHKIDAGAVKATWVFAESGAVPMQLGLVQSAGGAGAGAGSAGSATH